MDDRVSAQDDDSEDDLAALRKFQDLMDSGGSERPSDLTLLKCQKFLETKADEECQ